MAPVTVASFTMLAYGKKYLFGPDASRDLEITQFDRRRVGFKAGRSHWGLELHAPKCHMTLLNLEEGVSNLMNQDRGFSNSKISKL